jgi:hypothetical protein
VNENILAQIAYLDDSLDKSRSEGQALTSSEATDMAMLWEVVRAAFAQKEGLWSRNEELSSRIALLEHRVERIARRVAIQRSLPTVHYIYSEKPGSVVFVSPETADIGVTEYPLSLAEKRKLEGKVRFLETQLQSDRPYSQLYRLGAGSLFVAIISLVFWGLTGIGAPFHPTFAVTLIPASIGAIVMAFLIRRGMKEGKAASADNQVVKPHDSR